MASYSLDRQQAMLDAEDGHLPEADAALSRVIDELRACSTPQQRSELCQALLNRSQVRGFAGRRRDALDDLAACERVAEPLKEGTRRTLLTSIYDSRARLLSDHLSPCFDLREARRALEALRALDGPNWIPGATEAGILFRERQWRRSAELDLEVAGRLEAQAWKRGAAACRLRAGRALIELGELDAARAPIEWALEFFSRQGPPDLEAAATLGQARVKHAAGEVEAAWELARRALAIVESLVRYIRAVFDQQRYLADKLDYYRHAFVIALGDGGPTGIARAWEIAERSKSFYLCQLVANADVDLFEGVPAEQLARLKQLERELDLLEAGASRNDETYTALSRERTELLQRLMTANPRWATLRIPPPFDLEGALASLPAGTGCLSYFWLDAAEGSTLHLFHAGADRRPRHRATTWTADELDQLDRARAAPHSAPTVFMTSILPAALASKVIPDEVLEETSGCSKLLVTPHRRLRLMPLHALKLGDGSLLIERVAVQYLPTLALLALARRAAPPPRVLLLGCAEDGFGSPPLPEVRNEMKALSELWSQDPGTEVLPVELSSEDRLERRDVPLEAWARYGIVHIACHGTFDPDEPLNASLRLGSDALRGSELFSVRLAARLVCLSACDVGRHADRFEGLELGSDEWLGLALPLFHAGAENLVVSLWKANSEQATPFMHAMHGALAEGQEPACAFRAAALAVKGIPLGFWANWYLAGFPVESPSSVGVNASGGRR